VAFLADNDERVVTVGRERLRRILDRHKPAPAGASTPVSDSAAEVPGRSWSEASLHEYQVELTTELLACPSELSDDHEAESFVETDGALVRAVDGSDHDPLAREQGMLDERCDQGPAYSSTPAVLANVNGVFDRGPIARPAVSISAARDVYIESRDLAAIHISLHASGACHVKQSGIDAPPRLAVWERPDPHVPGYTRLYDVNIASIGLKPADRHRANVRWLQPGPTGTMVSVSIWREEIGANPEGWPGRNHGTHLVDRLASFGGGEDSVAFIYETGVELSDRARAKLQELLDGMADAVPS
jgi:hypothetical protein